MSKPVTFLKEARQELAKVVWPSRDDLIRHTSIVVVLSLLVAAFLGLMDFIFQKIIARII